MLLRQVSKTFNAQKLEECAQMCVDIKNEVEAFKVHVPLITSLRNPGMKARHYEQLSQVRGACCARINRLSDHCRRAGRVRSSVTSPCVAHVLLECLMLLLFVVAVTF